MKKKKEHIIKSICQFCGKENYVKYDEDEKMYLCLTCKNNRQDKKK